MSQILTADTAQHFARIALGHVQREYPYKPGNVLSGPEDAKTPSQLHPIFHGSFDWHSCVHGYWLLAHILSRCPEVEAATAIRSLFDEMLVPDKVVGECATLAA